jgi:hypothetical protein
VNADAPLQMVLPCRHGTQRGAPTPACDEGCCAQQRGTTCPRACTGPNGSPTCRGEAIQISHGKVSKTLDAIAIAPSGKCKWFIFSISLTTPLPDRCIYLHWRHSRPPQPWIRQWRCYVAAAETEEYLQDLFMIEIRAEGSV